MQLVCFPWAGGSGTLYAPWLKHELITSTFSSIICIDYPGRASRSDQEPIRHIDPLVESILDQNDCFRTVSEQEGLVLFGHSFGAIVAFEVTRRLEERGRRPIAIFVSACGQLDFKETLLLVWSQLTLCVLLLSLSTRALLLSLSTQRHFAVPPSKSPLVETQVSTLTVDEICDYFSSKGNPVSDAVLQTREFLDTFIKNVRVDYCCLETYPTTSKMLKTPLVVVGGELDQGVTIEDLKGWQKHRLSCGECEADFEGISRQDSPTRSISNDPGMRLYSNQGHFYLNDGVILEDLGVFVVETINTICVTAAKSNQVVEKEAEVKKHVVVT